jgi:histidinol dehydrogenase
MPEVKLIIDLVKKFGDQAIFDYQKQFSEIAPLRVSEKDIFNAYETVTEKTLALIRKQIQISREFHEKLAGQVVKFFETTSPEGVRCGFKKVPIDSVGLYIPAGKAPLPTVAQILTVAAKAALVPRIVCCFPPNDKEAAIIVAANEAGATEIYRVGGVAAIAALAYGTETIERVDKIVGPGSSWVQAAKLAVVSEVGIDMFSGPSEAVIIADESTNPGYVAADLLARCEHGPDSACVVATTSLELATKIEAEILSQIKERSRRRFIEQSLDRYSAILVFNNLEQIIEFTNEYSPEHLQIMTDNAKEIFKKIRHSGSTFLGHYAPVAIGDYASGTNHCLPTGRAVKYSSPISPETFLKTLQFQELNLDSLKQLEPIVKEISFIEGLDGHYASVSKRL